MTDDVERYRGMLVKLEGENAQLRVLLGIDQWSPGYEPVNVREIAATEVRRKVEAERDAARAAITETISELDSGFVGSRVRLKPLIDRLRAALGAVPAETETTE